jgi:hypothetical protein
VVLLLCLLVRLILKGGTRSLNAKTRRLKRTDDHHTVSLYTALTRWAVLKVIAGSLVKSILHMYSHVNVCIAKIAIARQATVQKVWLCTSTSKQIR